MLHSLPIFFNYCTRGPPTWLPNPLGQLGSEVLDASVDVAGVREHSLLPAEFWGAKDNMIEDTFTHQLVQELIEWRVLFGASLSCGGLVQGIRGVGGGPCGHGVR